MAAFCAGLLEERISNRRCVAEEKHFGNTGDEIAQYLRQKGYAVTEFLGRGKDGTVNVLNCSVLRGKAKT